MKMKLALLAMAIVALFAPLSQAQSVNCNATIIDNARVIYNPQVVANAARTLINQGADVHVVTVDSISRYGSNLAAVETFFEQSCPSWTTNGTRKANLYVVMVAPNDRQKNMFLGSYYAGAFDVPSTYSQYSNQFFKNRQWEMGLAAVLQGTTSQALNFRQRTFQAQQRTIPQQPTRTYTTTAPVQASSSGMSGFAIFMVVMFVMLALAIILYFVFRDSETTVVNNTTSYDPSYTPSYGSRSYAARAPGSTTVINNTSSGGDFVTGMVVGEMLSRPSQPSTVYVEPTPTYVAPSYTPDPTPAPAADAPDSSWEDTSTQQADTSFSAPDPDPSPSYDPPSYDPPSSDFGSSSNNDSGF